MVPTEQNIKEAVVCFVAFFFFFLLILLKMEKKKKQTFTMTYKCTEGNVLYITRNKGILIYFLLFFFTFL